MKKWIDFTPKAMVTSPKMVKSSHGTKIVIK